MKKLVAVIAVAVLVSALANASVNFNWAGTSGSAKDVNNVNLPLNTLALLYVSSDNIIDLDTGVKLKSIYGNDAFIASVGTVGGTGGRYSTVNQEFGVAGTGAGSYVGMFTYLVLVNQAYVGGATPESVAGGVYYGVSSIGVISGVQTTLRQYDTTPTPQLPQVFNDADSLVKTDIVNVPEPSTAMLLGIGVGLLALRRKLRA